MVKVKFDNGEVVEIVNDRLRIVSGWASIQIKDVQNHVVSALDLVKSMITYMANGGIILYGHTNTPVGKVLYWDLRKHDETGKLGVYIVAQIGNTDIIQDRVWELVKSGVITGFSIGGYGKPTTEVIKSDDGKDEIIKKVTNIVLKEISIVEHPANEMALIEDYNEMAKGFINHFSELRKCVEDFEKEVILTRLELGMANTISLLAEYYAQEYFEKTFNELCDIEKSAVVELIFDDYRKSKGRDACKERYFNYDEGHFKGRAGTGERFDNCVKYFTNCENKSEESARKICAAIARAKYGR